MLEPWWVPDPMMQTADAWGFCLCSRQLELGKSFLYSWLHGAGVYSVPSPRKLSPSCQLPQCHWCRMSPALPSPAAFPYSSPIPGTCNQNFPWLCFVRHPC
jgi:hypothetical protein